MYDVTMPKLSDSMETGKILAWKVKPDQEVHEGDVLAEVESDKAAMELECFHDGTISEIVKGDGSEVKVGEVIARIASKGESAGKKQEPVEAPAKEPEKKEPREEPKTEEESEQKPPAATKEEEPAPRKERVAISPYARKLAQRRGVDIAKVRGSGPDGRIIAGDIEEAAEGRPMGEKEEGAEAAEGESGRKPGAPSEGMEVSEDEGAVEEPSFRMKTQAQRVSASAREIPHFWVTTAVDSRALVAKAAELKDKGATLTHLVMKACVTTLTKHPGINRSYDGGRVISWKHVNLGLAVDTEQGLTVAVISRAEELTFAGLVERTRELVERARAGKLKPEDRRRATFTISNLGMFGVEDFQAVINPPSSVTLAVGSTLDVPVVRDGNVQAGKVMKLTAACDHRVVDGAAAARFLKDLKQSLESVESLLKCD